ncbi:MAG: hypothetical protein WD872_20625 [Pirellulaceae bacterium]
MSASSSAPLRGAPKPFLHKASGQAAVKVRGRFYYLGKHGSPAAREEYLRIIREVWSKPAAEAPAGLTLRQLDRLSVLDLLAGFWEHADRYYVKDGRPSTTIAAIAQSDAEELDGLVVADQSDDVHASFSFQVVH